MPRLLLQQLRRVCTCVYQVPSAGEMRDSEFLSFHSQGGHQENEACFVGFWGSVHVQPFFVFFTPGLWVSAVAVQASYCVQRHLKKTDANGLSAGVSGMRIAC